MLYARGVKLTLKLRVDISIEIEAADFIEAAGHQAAFQRHLSELHAEYPQAVMTIRERRGPRLTPVKRSEKLRRSGVLHQYVDRRRETA
jgi:hypothetical protein